MPRTFSAYGANEIHMTDQEKARLQKLTDNLDAATASFSQGDIAGLCGGFRILTIAASEFIKSVRDEEGR